MIYVTTVHWVDPKWIVPQRRALDRHLPGPFRVFGNLEGIGHEHDRHFDHVTRTGGPHPTKLNALADAVAAEAADDDVLIFLDGDAFPVRGLHPWLGDLLAAHPLVAVRRDENGGDTQPHPCFCATTVGFWRHIGGDWRPAPWTRPDGTTAEDVGGKLLGVLEGAGVAWHPLLRSNHHDLHPVFYGIYGSRIYHHGAGFRPPIARVDGSQVSLARYDQWEILPRHARTRSVLDVRPRHAVQLVRRVGTRVRRRDLTAYIRSEQRRSDEIYRQICTDPTFHRQFESRVSQRSPAP